MANKSIVFFGIVGVFNQQIYQKKNYVKLLRNTNIYEPLLNIIFLLFSYTCTYLFFLLAMLKGEKNVCASFGYEPLVLRADTKKMPLNPKYLGQSPYMVR